MSNRFAVAHVGWHECDPAWQWQRSAHSMTYHDVWLVCAGSGTLHANGEQHRITAGEALIFAPQVAAAAWQDPDNQLSVVFAFFAGDHPFADDTPLRRGQVRDEPLLKQVFLRAHRAWHEAGNAAATERWLAAALVEIADDLRHPGKSRFDRYGAALRDLCQGLREHPDRHASNADLAAQIGVSIPHFMRLFRAHTGMSPHAWLIRQRLSRAQSLLEFTDTSIGDIAARLGYPDQFTFTKQFRKHLGSCPRIWRSSRAGD